MDGLLIAASLAGLASTLYMILAVAAGLGLVIFVHELGHFLVAKSCGVKCEKFYIGFDVPISLGPLKLPRTLGKFQWGETEYGIGIIPLGGYVKMLGQDDNPGNADEEASRIRVVKPDGTVEFDPRSYPAKAVWQRMLIISAGVTMNLISAVFFAAIAYRAGVPYTTCEIGGFAPGDPAWTEGLQPGDKIVRFGRDGERDDHMRFEHELRQHVHFHGPVPLDLEVQRGDESKWVTLTPTKRQSRDGTSITIGVVAMPTTTIATGESIPGSPLSQLGDKGFRAGDRIVAVNDQPLKLDGQNERGDYRGLDLQQLLATNLDQPLKMTVERLQENSTERTRVDVNVPTNPIRTLGLVPTMGAVVAVRKGSPAAEAGFQIGDVLKSIDGQPIDDPLKLPQQMPAFVDRTVTVEVERLAAKAGEASDKSAGRQLVSLQVTPRGPPAYDELGVGRNVGLEQLGIAYSIRPVVQSVLPDSPAAREGLRAGDTIVRFQRFADSAELKATMKKLYGKRYDTPLDVTETDLTWPRLHGVLQDSPRTLRFVVTYLRDNKENVCTLSTIDAPGWFNVDRGLSLKGYSRVHVASSWGEAMALGWRETGERLGEVLTILKMLVTGRISLGNFGGPVMIAMVAGSEAAQGIPRLLLFLTLLSANLAILNMLPIPALDGGHMVFLTAEWVRGKPVDEKVQVTLTLVGVACLLGLMVFVMGNDVYKLFVR